MRWNKAGISDQGGGSYCGELHSRFLAAPAEEVGRVLDFVRRAAWQGLRHLASDGPETCCKVISVPLLAIDVSSLS